MTAVKIKAIRFICDQCECSEVFECCKIVAVARAVSEGWDIGKGDDADLCPGCSEADRVWREQYTIERYGL